MLEKSIPEQPCKLVHIFCFKLHRRMNVFVHRNTYAGMTKDFRQALDIKPKFHTAGSEGVTGGMKVGILNTAFLKDSLETVLHYPGFHELRVASR